MLETTMKKIAGILVLAVALTGCATTASNKIPVPDSAQKRAFGHPIPTGAPFDSQAIVSTDHPGVHQYMAAKPWRIAHFRPNTNMPEFINADMINNTLSEEKAANIQRQLAKGQVVLMTIPRLTLLPCDEGCVGNSDYEKMSKRFESSYYELAQPSSVAIRGEMKVKVRWMRKKSFIENINPISFAQQAFAIEFPIEGNMLTLSASTFGDKAKLEDCVDSVVGKFKFGVIFPLALGLRNYYTVTLDPNYDPSLMAKVNSWLANPVRGMQKMVGQTNYSSRVEPIASAHQVLLPAIDGLKAGEGIDVGSGKLFDSF